MDTEGAARSVLSSFLPAVPSLPTEAPEHFPLRKTGEQADLRGAQSRQGALDLGQEYGVEGGLGQLAHYVFFFFPLSGFTFFLFNP